MKLEPIRRSNPVPLDQILEPLNWDEIDLAAFEKQHSDLVWELRKATFLKRFDCKKAASVLSRVMDRRITAKMVRHELESCLRRLRPEAGDSCFECLLDVIGRADGIEASVRLFETSAVANENLLAAAYVAVLGDTK